MYNRIKSFSENVDTTLVIASSNNKSNDYKLSRKYFPELKQIIVLPRTSIEIKKVSYFKKGLGILKWLISGKPRRAQTIESEANKNKITEYIFSEKIDIVILEFPYCAELIKIDQIRKNNIKIFVVIHNIEFLFFRDSMKLPKIVMDIEINRIKKYECNVLQQVDGILGISPWDIDYVNRNMQVNNAKYLPTYFRKPILSWKGNLNSQYINFCGALSFYPNYHGIKWFLENVFVNYVKSYPKIKLKITGKVNERIQKELERYKNVEFTGYLSEKELEFVIINSMFSVVPIIKGSGIKIKLLESLSYGVPTVTTIHGAQGIPYKGEAPYLVGKDENEFLTQMNILTNSNEKRKTLGHRARIFFEMNYASEKNIQDWIASVSRY